MYDLQLNCEFGVQNSNNKSLTCGDSCDNCTTWRLLLLEVPGSCLIDECLCCEVVSVDFAREKRMFQICLCRIWVYQGWFDISEATRISFVLSWYRGLTKFYFDWHVFLLEFVHIKYIWVNVFASEILALTYPGLI